MPDLTLPRLAVVADLTIEVGDDLGATTARLTSTDGLVLDVEEPAVLLRCVPGRGLRRDLPISFPLERLADLPVLLTSQGRDVGRVHITSAGRVRFRPFWSGVPVVARVAVTSSAARVGPRSLLAAAVSVLGLLGVLVLRRRRRS